MSIGEQKIHIDRYLPKDSNPYPTERQGKPETDRTKQICGVKHLPEEHKHLEETFQTTGYSTKEINTNITYYVQREELIKSTEESNSSQVIDNDHTTSIPV